MRRYVFVDRDDTLVRDTGYPHTREGYVLLPGVPAALRRLRDAGWRLAIVTNQSGIGRGYYGFDAFARFQAILYADLAAAGVTIDATFVCPHLPDAGCPCRKPEPGLLFRARDVLAAPLAECWMIGDSERDVGAARSAGCRGVVRVGIASPSGAGDPHSLEARDVPAAVEAILRYGAP